MKAYHTAVEVCPTGRVDAEAFKARFTPPWKKASSWPSRQKSGRVLRQSGSRKRSGIAAQCASAVACVHARHPCKSFTSKVISAWQGTAVGSTAQEAQGRSGDLEQVLVDFLAA